MEKKKQIFFLHFAGGSCQSYNFLSKSLRGFDMHQLELPGRGKRSFDPFVEGLEAAVDDYTQQILDLSNGEPFILYGHSMGALIGIHLTQKLEALQQAPELLIVSGNAGPGIEQDKQRHLLQGQAFLNELRLMGGMPEIFFEDEDLIDYFSPVLRSDFKLVETNSYKTLPPVLTSIVCLIGEKDVNYKNRLNWKRFTKSDFECRTFVGGHFFIHDYVDEITAMIKKCLNRQPAFVSG